MWPFNLQLLSRLRHPDADANGPSTWRARWSTEGLADLTSMRDLHGLIRRERELCQRGRPSFTLVVFDIGRHEADFVLAERLVHAFRKRARISDTIGWFDEARICLLLRMTPHTGAQRVADELCSMLGARRPHFHVLGVKVEAESCRVLVSCARSWQ